jgi:hypothetical protein
VPKREVKEEYVTPPAIQRRGSNGGGITIGEPA